MRAAIIAIGNELTSGLSTETNSRYLIEQLKYIGVNVDLVSIIGDTITSIAHALDHIESEINLVFITGGLGPTHDDITKKATVQYFDSPLEFNNDAFQQIKTLFDSKGLSLSDLNKQQAMLPNKAIIIPNLIGTAQGMKFEKDGRLFFFMPGVPVEMKKMFRNFIRQDISKLINQKISFEIIHTTGLPESEIFSKISHWIDSHPELTVSLLPRFPAVDIALSLNSNDNEHTPLSSYIDEINAILGDVIYGFGSDTLESVIAEILTAEKLTIATAESCTGGLIAHRLTNVPGSSNYFMQGAVCYSNQSKMDILGVKENTLNKYGAVSPETALEMASGIRKNANTDIGLSTTGIAGPSGGLPQKPVGTVYVGLSMNQTDEVFHFLYKWDRVSNKTYFAQMALNQLRLALKRE